MIVFSKELFYNSYSQQKMFKAFLRGASNKIFFFLNIVKYRFIIVTIKISTIFNEIEIDYILVLIFQTSYNTGCPNIFDTIDSFNNF